MQLRSKPGGHVEMNSRPSGEGVSFYHVLRPLDPGMHGYPVGQEACTQFKRACRRSSVHKHLPALTPEQVRS